MSVRFVGGSGDKTGFRGRIQGPGGSTGVPTGARPKDARFSLRATDYVAVALDCFRFGLVWGGGFCHKKFRTVVLSYLFRAGVAGSSAARRRSGCFRDNVIGWNPGIDRLGAEARPLSLGRPSIQIENKENQQVSDECFHADYTNLRNRWKYGLRAKSSGQDGRSASPPKQHRRAKARRLRFDRLEKSA
jgi:hypothetical protein